MKVSPARRAAFEILRRVEEEGAYSSVLLAVTDETLNAKDRALTHELVLGVLRRRLWLDRAVEHFAARPVDKLDLPVTLALRLGLYQLRFLDRVPASAAVNESVNLVRWSRVKSAASFVNAVLRRATREPNYDPAANAADQTERLAIETSHPRWLIERWASQFGVAEAAAFAHANNQPAPVAFRFTAKSLGESESILRALRQAGIDLVESRIAAGAWRTSASAHELLRKLSENGQIYFQDEASQLVAQLAEGHAGHRVLDVCAAPGSKTTLLAVLAPNASIIAGDFYEHRVLTIRNFAAQQGAATIQLIVHDATQPLPFADESFDRVMVDAPCSGTGTLRHNPEIRWRLQHGDIADLGNKQRQILANAARAVRPGGLLLYSTCSVESEENEDVVRDFCANFQQFESVTVAAPSFLATSTSSLRTWPHRDEVDGFFVAALRRV